MAGSSSRQKGAPSAPTPTQTIRVIHPKPDIERGVAYWQSVPASVNGVLGGYGLGTVPRIDSMGSRLFLLKNLKRLANVPPASADPGVWAEEKMRWRETSGKGKAVTRALDCGAGVGRVTQSVLLPLVDEVHLVEPVEKVRSVVGRPEAPFADMLCTSLVKVPPRSQNPINQMETDPNTHRETTLFRLQGSSFPPSDTAGF